jgi:hypothetical protein
LIDNVGLVLNSDEVGENAPKYIQKLRERGNVSMLPFELYESIHAENSNYLGGNWFGDAKPRGLLDPTSYLRSASTT